MTLAEMLKILRAPSDEAWSAMTNWIDTLKIGASEEALPALREALEDWPEYIQRSAKQQWARANHAQFLDLCRAPGGLLVEVAGGGGGMSEEHVCELVDVDRLEEAVLTLLGSVFDESGDCDSTVYATPFSHGQLVGSAVDLAPHIEARYAKMSRSFRLDAIPPEVHEALRTHYRRCVEGSHEGPHDERFVPLDLTWDPRDLSWPEIGGEDDWFGLERVRVNAGARVIYDDASPVQDATREFWPALLTTPASAILDAVTAALLQEPEPEEEDEQEQAPSIAKMLAAQGLDELLTTLLRVLEHFGVWASRDFDDAYARVLYELEMLPNPGGRSKRICETLTDFGHLEGPAVETVSGLLVCHTLELDVFRKQLRTLRDRQQLQLREGGEVEALVPLCAWAVSTHRSVPTARAALAEAMLEHPFVDDLFCEDAALLPHLGG